MKRLFVCFWILGSAFGHDPSLSARPLVKVSLPRVLEAMGQYQEWERQSENPGALLLYPLMDRLDTMIQDLKEYVAVYEQENRVRMDISEFYEDTPDYTDDFLEKMSEMRSDNE